MAYCSVSDVKKYSQVTFDQLGFTSDAEFEAFISNTLIPRAEEVINQFCGRDFNLHLNQTTYLDGDGSNILRPPGTPIISISSLSENSDTLGTGSWMELNSDDYAAKENYIVTRSATVAGVKNYKLVYTYGYESAPADVADVCARLCANALQVIVLNKSGPLVRVGDYRVEWADRTILTEDLKALLAPRVKTRLKYA